MGLACKLFGHKWNDRCKCYRCGQLRDEGHDFSHHPIDEHYHSRYCTICKKKFEPEPHEFKIEARFDGPTFFGKKFETVPRDILIKARFDKSNFTCVKRCFCGLQYPVEHNYVPVKNRCQKVCTVCKNKIPTEHKFEYIEKQCKKVCSVCGKTIPWHKYSEGKCVVCGKNALKDNEILADEAFAAVASISNKELLEKIVDKYKTGCPESVRLEAALKLDDKVLKEYLFHVDEAELAKAIGAINNKDDLKRIVDSIPLHEGNNPLHLRWCACKRLGDEEQISATEKLARWEQNGHLVYRAKYSDWEYCVNTCMCCAASNKTENDSESQRTYGKSFYDFSCTPVDIKPIRQSD